ncbi:hypothetical protein P9112_007531 [Eukaryota sp. TZLM1-RC]
MRDILKFPRPPYNQHVLNFDHGAGIPVSSINIAGTAVGAGVLALPFATASLGSGNAAIFFGVASFLSIIMFMLLIRHSLFLSAFHLESLVAKSFGSTAGVVSSFLIFIYLIGILSVYLILLSTSFSLAMAYLTGTHPAQRYFFSNFRIIVILFAYVLCFPLGLKRSLESLRLFTLVSLLIIFYTIGYLIYATLRFFAGTADLRSPEAIDGGRTHPSFVWSPLSVVMGGLSTLAFAFSSHLSAPNIVREMYKSSIARLDKAVWCAFALIITAYTLTMTFGFILFGTGVTENLMTSLDFNTLGAFFANAGIVFFFAVSYAIVFQPTKDQAISLLEKLSEKNHYWQERLGGWFESVGNGDISVFKSPPHFFLVLVMVSLTVAIAVISEEIGRLVTFLGSVVASWLIFILPPLIYFKKVFPKSTFTTVVCIASLIFGVFIFSLGGYFSLIDLVTWS